MKTIKLLSTISLSALTIMSCEKDPIDEIQDDYLYEMMTQEEVLVEETKTIETSTTTSTIEVTSETTTSTIEVVSDVTTSTIELTQVASDTIAITSVATSTTNVEEEVVVESTQATTTIEVEATNDSNDSNDSNESNEVEVAQVEAPQVEAPQVVETQVVSQVVEVVEVVEAPQLIVVNANDLDWESFDVNAQDIVVMDGVEYTSVEFQALVDAHVANVAAQVQANEAQVQAHANVEAPQVEAPQQAQVNNNLVDVAVMIDVDSNDFENITIENFFYDGQAEIGQTISVGVSIQVKDGYKLSSLVGGSEVVDNGNENYFVKYHATIDGNPTLTIGNKQVYNAQVTIEVEKK